jgi:exodeoxyribonuclease V alpha subunit
MIPVLHAWRAAGRITAVELHFGALLARRTGAAGPRHGRAAALAGACVLRAARQGHVCIRLDDLQAEAGAAAGLTDTEEWRAALLDGGVAAPPGQAAPLILDAGGRLYLQRHHAAEARVARQLRQRASQPRQMDAAALRAALAARFDGVQDLWPAVAAATVALRGLCIITGGPGSGKTHTLARLLEVLRSLAPQPLRMALAAPTGKAAARLDEALAPVMAPRAQTLHRLLGARADGSFQHGSRQPLAVDVLVVDEASMVPLLLMDQLLAALPPQALLILAGDRDQLASVEAGAVLAGICARSGPSAAWAGTLSALLDVAVPANSQSPAAFSDTVVALRHSHRFGSDSGIGRLARAVLAGEGAAAQTLLQAPPPGLAWQPGFGAAGLEAGWSAYQPIFQNVLDAARAGEGIAEALEQLQALRVLAGPREGPAGVAAINHTIERLLGVAGRTWYAGRPLLITRNDHELGLYNGDMGMVLPVAGELRACFPGPAGTPLNLPLARLPPHETAWCLTVHKAQGSEYRGVLLVLPEADSPLLTREWLYTGLTRARQELQLLGDAAAVTAAAARGSRREGGLCEYLHEISEFPD